MYTIITLIHKNNNQLKKVTLINSDNSLAQYSLVTIIDSKSLGHSEYNEQSDF